jgi:hypothetical protein
MISTWSNTTRPEAQEGIIGFNIETSKLEIYNGSSWVAVSLS